MYNEIKEIEKQVRKEYLENFDPDDFVNYAHCETHFPEYLEEIHSLIDELTIKISTLKKAYGHENMLPLYYINTDFESLNIKLDEPFQALLGMIESGMKIEKTYISGEEE